MIDRVNGRLQAYCLKNNLNQKDICELTGISTATFNNIWLGKSLPSFEVLEAIVKKLPIDAHWLITGEGDMADIELNVIDKYKLRDIANDPSVPYGSSEVVIEAGDIDKSYKLIIEFLKKEIASKDAIIAEKERVIQLLLKTTTP